MVQEIESVVTDSIQYQQSSVIELTSIIINALVLKI